MTINYVCNHCHKHIATLNHVVSEQQLGLSILNEQEKYDRISYNAQGHMCVQISCDDCYEALSADETTFPTSSYAQQLLH